MGDGTGTNTSFYSVAKEFETFEFYLNALVELKAYEFSEARWSFSEILISLWIEDFRTSTVSLFSEVAVAFLVIRGIIGFSSGAGASLVTSFFANYFGIMSGMLDSSLQS